MRWLSAACMAVGVVFGAASAGAEPTLAELSAQFAQGRFQLAAESAEAAGGAEKLALAARALLALSMTGDGAPDPQTVDRARLLAERALSLAPDSADARLQLAIALSLKGRAADLMDALRAGYARDGRRLVSEALAQEPDNAYLHAFMAVWNLEVRRRGGAVGAGYMGAGVDQARASYDRAAALAPDDVGLHWQYARALAALDARAHRAEVREVLARALAARADDRLEQVMQDRAHTLAAAFDTGDMRAVERLAQGML